MSSKDHLSDYQFNYHNDGPQYKFSGYFNDVEDDEANGYDLYTHRVNAKHVPSNRIVGEMFYQSDGPLFQIDVDRSHRRRGVAEGMVQHANKVSKDTKGDAPMPMRASHETDEGAVWADSMVERGILKDNR
jgi:GNAT superfamily N-acetyltransferase